VSESASRPCGCRYIRPGSLMWYQVVACPDHDLDWAPQAGLPPDAGSVHPAGCTEPADGFDEGEWGGGAG
jgi:hypothetical protein